jgi:hypothetical protein
MATQPKIILFELNEVPFKVIDDFCTRYSDSVLARVLPLATQYVTHTDDEPLSPWITWPTLHRGVGVGEHGIAYLGADTAEVDKSYPPIWQTLAQRGLRVGVFGSLHTYPVPADPAGYAFYVPDTFAADGKSIPSSIDAFQELNLRLARASARNVSVELPWKQGLGVLARSPSLGLRAATLASLARQVVMERVRPARRVRRRTYQSILGFDIFMKLLKRTKPDFATFFTNHVASSMHRYWAAAYPGDYDSNNYGPEWQATYGAEIDFTMLTTDRLLGRVVRFVERNPDYRLWVASSMGQAATFAEPMETQLYATNVPRLMQALGVADAEDWHERAAMLPQISVYVAPAAIDAFRDSLQHLEIDGNPLVFTEKTGGFFSLNFGQVNLQDKPGLVVLNGTQATLDRLGLSLVAIEDAANSNAYHIPDGTLFTYDPTAAPTTTGERARIPLTAVNGMLREALALEA